MEIIFAIILFLPAMFSIFISVYALSVAKTKMYQPALFYMQSEYREPKMLNALRDLWLLHEDATKKLNLTKKRNRYRLREKEKDDIKKEIRKKYKKTFKEEKKKGEYDLDNKRRIVSHYIQHLGNLRNNELLTDEQIQNFFPSNIAETIRMIIIPIERELIDILNEVRPWAHPDDIKKEKEDLADKLEEVAKIWDKKSKLLSFSFSLNK